MSLLLRSRLWGLQVSPLKANRLNQFRRAFHEAKADFISLDMEGSLTTREVDIFIGEPHQAYIMIDKDVGFDMSSPIIKQADIAFASDPAKIPLKFFHETRHFAHSAVPYPRIVIRQNLPRQNETNSSVATLWLCGASHSITLDGTPDEDFVASCRESHERLKGTIELLRDR